MSTGWTPFTKHGITARLKGYFLTGLLVLIPISLTVYILIELFLAIDGILKELIFVFLEPLGFSISGRPIPGMGFVTLLLLILTTGMAARSYFGKKLVNVGERAVTKIPFMRRIYGTVRQLALALFGEERESFKKTVLVEFPGSNMWRLGFYVQQMQGEIKEALQNDIVSVFIPHTPNPTGGFLVFFPKPQVIELDMTIEDALNMIISGGTVVPPQRPARRMPIGIDQQIEIVKRQPA